MNIDKKQSEFILWMPEVLNALRALDGSGKPKEVSQWIAQKFGLADKGIIFTTGRFSEDAKREANREGAPAIELFDGEKLVELLERYQIGIIPVSTFEIDEKFFAKFSLGNQ